MKTLPGNQGHLGQQFCHLRELLGMDRPTLASLARVPETEITRVEESPSAPDPLSHVVCAIHLALTTSALIALLEETGCGEV